jgi:hypothetical protein
MLLGVAKGADRGNHSRGGGPQQLPNGWTNAGLQPGDGIQAIRTAVAFNDREMSLDNRSVGTRDNLRIPPQDAGNNPAMGGTGWLVSNYGLNLPNGTALNIVQPA